MNYAEYIAESLSKSIEYSEYLAESLHKSTTYEEYIAECLDPSYTEKKKIVELRIKRKLLSKERKEKINKINEAED